MGLPSHSEDRNLVMQRLRFVSLIALLAAIGLFTSNLRASQTPGWGVVVATNAFVAHGEGADAPVAIGASITQGDRITTKAGGALVLTRGEDLVTMAENSQITITDPQPLNATMIQQAAGDVQYHVTKGPAPHFEVDTPLLATVVKGTTFRITSGIGGSSVAVSEGRVVAKDRRSDKSASVGAGETGSVDTGHGGVSVNASASTNTSAAPSSSPSSSSDASASSGSDSSGDGKDKSNNGNGNSGNGGGNSGSGNSGNGGGNSGSGNSGSGGNGGGNGNGNNGNGNGNGGSNGNSHGNGNLKKNK
jgi:hypothetical protein